MTRIIAGFAGSITLQVPGAGTRPTSDRVREAIFSALDSRGVVDGSRVLDLYAGSGALGLEAASRGASHVLLVEQWKHAADVCRRNAAAVLRQGPPELAIEVSSQPVQSFLTSNLYEWDIVMLDPPYDLGEVELMHVLQLLVPRLAPDAVVMVERSSRSPEPAWPDGMTLDRRKDYGDTTLWWSRPVG
jgi:16S rRNA (guanine966-N2)-methyltransferase